MAREHDGKRRITAVDLVGVRTPLGPTVAPDGSQVAFVVSEPDFARSEVRSQVHVAPEPEGPHARYGARQVTFGLADTTQPAFSPDGRTLAVLCFRPQPHEDETDDRTEDGGDKRQVHLLAGDRGDARRLTDRVDGVDTFRWWPDGDGVVTLGRAHRPPAEASWRRQRHDNLDDPYVVDEDIPRMEIWHHPLRGRARRLLSARRGVEDFDVSPDGRLLAYATNHTGRTEDADKSEIVVLDLQTGEERRLTDGRGGCESAPRFTADGRHLLFHGWNDPRIAFSRQELFAVALDGPPGPPRPLLAGLDRDLEHFAPTSDGRLAASVADGFESSLVLVDPETGAVSRLPFDGHFVSGLAAASQAPVLAVVAEDGDSLPEVWRIDTSGGAGEAVTELHPEADEWRFARRARIRWESEGFEHEGLVISPPLAQGDPPPPLLVWVHGGPHWRAIDTLQVYEAEVVAAEGFAVFLPQFRGSAGYGEAYALACRGDLGGADARDILAGVDKVVAGGLADGTRIAVAGSSYGGYMTNWLLATTDRFKAGVSMSGIFDLAQDYATSSYSSWEVQYLGALPWENPELYRQRSPITHAASIEAPVLILHGLDDDTTLFTNSKGLHRALGELGRESQLVLYPREGHGLFEPAHRVDAIHRILDWLNRHVAGRADRPSVHVAGRSVVKDGLRLIPLGHSVRREYAGVRPAEGHVFLEVSLLLRSEEDGPASLRLVPSGASSDVVLIDEHGDLHRPIGVPVTVHDQPALFAARGALEARSAEDDPPPSLPAAVVFEIPDWPGLYRLGVFDLPTVMLDVLIEPEDADEGDPEGAEGAGEDSRVERSGTPRRREP